MSTAVLQDHRALRFLTAGSVDDGKSTLIGRLLFDSRAILADQLDTLEKKAAGAPIDLSLLTDGLEAEREQGITIDVAYRYFATRNRKFIIADAPGHEQYTRNMVTAAAGSDAAVVLVDITKLDTHQTPLVLLPQTRRHSLLATCCACRASCSRSTSSMQSPIRSRRSMRSASRCAHSPRRRVSRSPASCRCRRCVATTSRRRWSPTAPTGAPGTAARPCCNLLESLPAAQERTEGDLLIPVQYVAREGEGTGNQPRTLWGRIAHGSVKAGDDVQIFPSGQRAVVAEVRLAGSAVDRVEAGRSAGVVLDRQLDVSRGDWISTPGSVNGLQSFAATLAWLDTEPAVVGRKYWVRHGNRWVQARIASIESRLDIHTLEAIDAHELAVNEIGHVIVETQQPLPVEAYASNRSGGSLIVVDPTTNRTSGALLVKSAA